MSAQNEMPLAQALMRLGLSWPQGYRAILTGELRGRQLANKRWVVEADSVEQYRERASALAPQAAASA